MRRRNRWVWTVLLLGLLVSPEVLAQVETTPSLTWTATFAGTKPSGETFLAGGGAGVNNGFDRDSGFGSCAQPGQAVSIEWTTGDFFVAWTDGTATESGGVHGVGKFTRLEGTNGAIGSQSFFESASHTSAACGVAVDQRGRVYGQVGPCDTTFNHQSFAASSADFDDLGLFDLTDTCPSGGDPSLLGVYVDVFSDRSVNGTRFGFSTGVPQTLWMFESSVSDAVTYTPICSITSVGTSLQFRNDGVNVDKAWDIDGNGNVGGFTPSDCSGNFGNTLGGTACTTARWSLDCFRVDTAPNPDQFVRNGLNHVDFSGAIAINDTTLLASTEVPDGTDNGLDPVPSTIYEVFTDVDGDYVACGSVVEGVTFHHFIAKWNSDFDTLLWNVTLPRSTFNALSCDLGKNGEVAWAGMITGPNRGQVRKYCCNDVGVNRSQLSHAQIVLPPEGGGGGGAAFDLSAQCEAIGTAMGIGVFGCNLLMTAVLMLGMAISTTTTTAIATRGRAMALLGVAFAVGALIGLLIAWALEFATGIIIFVITMIAIVLIGLFVLIRRG